ncbi:MAG: hypothetical protein ACRD5G_02635 [Candidatus Acidiferrales bacterium]
MSPEPLASSGWQLRRNQVLSAMKEFDSAPDRYRTGTRYLIWHNGKQYPPKALRSIIENKPVSSFAGGGATNEMFRELGFALIMRKAQTKRMTKTFSSTLTTPASALLERLFSTRWQKLAERPRLNQGEYPGVYLLAYTSENLLGQKVVPEHVFYVGMSTTALNTRLAQFWDGIHRCCAHSGAMRFYRCWARNRNFSELCRTSRDRFYVTAIAIPCCAEKEFRTYRDLLALGRVVELEYAALAKIKRETGLEPPLNRK